MSQYRLPTTSKPIHYDIALVPDLVAFTFQGHLLLDLQINEKVNKLVLNSADLTYPNNENNKPRVTIKPKPSPLAKDNNNLTEQKGIECSSIELEEKTHRVTFNFANELDSGLYELSVHYNGILNDQLCGFYRSSYTKPDGTKSMMATTQFEATDARRALPCYDEPAVKATFTVTLIVPGEYTALSNMPVVKKIYTLGSSDKSEQAINRGLIYPAGYARYLYDKTPIMSTYLLAFIVAELEYISSFTKSKVMVSVYTPVGKTHLAKFSLDVAVKALEFYDDYFGIPYPLPKSDLVAIPDFAAGAMENWGLVTYREVAVLIDPANSSAAIKQRCARTVCHELAHMWFGNLVTMDWWTYLWLNEGFARFIEHLAVNHLFPEWDIWTQFVSDVVQQAAGLDALESSHPIEVLVNHSDEVNEIFDTISYAKGASCIRMLHSSIGDQAWRKGLHAYLTKFAYSNATTENLWDSLSAAANTNVTHLMDHWIKKTGYPVVTIEEIECKTEGKRNFRFSQRRFYANMEGREANHDEIWNIPLTASTVDGKHTDKIVVEKPAGEISLSLPAGPIKFNVNQAGFYRVKLSDKLFNDLLPHIKELSATDRLGLQRDIFAISSSGLAPIGPALDLLNTFNNESNFSVISAFSGNVSMLANLHKDESYYPQLQKFVAHLYKNIFNELGWENKSNDPVKNHTAGMIRATILPLLGLSGDKQITEAALQKLKAFVEDETKNNIPGDLRSAVYSIAMKAGGLTVREQLLTIYHRTNSQEEKSRILSCLGAVSGKGSDDAKIIKLNLDMAFNENEVRSGEVAYLVNSCSSSKLGRDLTWEYLKDHWDTLITKYSKGQNFLIAAILSGPLNNTSSLDDANEFEQWFKVHPVPSADRVIKQSSENVRQKAARLTRERSQLQDWLNKNKY